MDQSQHKISNLNLHIFIQTEKLILSQIDYILSNNDTLLSTKIYSQDAVSTRTHAPVKASTKLYLEKKKSIETKKNTVAYKLIWEEMDDF